MESYFEALAPYGCNGYKEPVFFTDTYAYLYMRRLAYKLKFCLSFIANK